MAGETVFVDTSAFLALLNADDDYHRRASSALDDLERRKARLVTSNYVRLESWSLIQSRLGIPAVRAFASHLLAPCEVIEITENQFREAGAALLRAGRRTVSLVDMTSFTVMRDHGVRFAFSCDKHFRGEGFTLPK